MIYTNAHRYSINLMLFQLNELHIIGRGPEKAAENGSCDKSCDRSCDCDSTDTRNNVGKKDLEF